MKEKSFHGRKINCYGNPSVSAKLRWLSESAFLRIRLTKLFYGCNLDEPFIRHKHAHTLPPTQNPTHPHTIIQMAPKIPVSTAVELSPPLGSITFPPPHLSHNPKLLFVAKPRNRFRPPTTKLWTISAQSPFPRGWMVASSRTATKMIPLILMMLIHELFRSSSECEQIESNQSRKVV